MNGLFAKPVDTNKTDLDLNVALLRQFEVLATSDPKSARGFIAAAFSPHSLEVLSGTLNVRMHYAALPSVGIALLDYGARVRVETKLNTWFGAICAIQGRFRCTTGHASTIGDAGSAIVLSPSEQATFDFEEGCTLMVVKMDRVAVERAAVRAMSKPLTEPLVFDLAMPRATGKAQTFWRLAETLIRELGTPGSGITHGPVAAQMEQLMFQALLSAQPYGFSALEDSKPRLAPHYVKMAEAYMSAHADEDVDLDALCRASNVSRRTLYAGFQKYRGVSPMLYLKNIRLERARRDLLSAGPDTTVTDVATRWGFLQLGRFAGEYKRRFGESPSDTLRFNLTLNLQ